jgi:uncharacterized protein
VQQQRPANVNNASAYSATVWSLSDAKAGNRRQADALAHALGQPFRDWTLQPQAPWHWLAPRQWPGSGRAFGEDFARAAPPRLAIGCGRQAALATRLLRGRGARAVQILDPRIATDHWDLVIAPEHDRLRGDNVIALLGSLHPVDDLWLAAARRDFDSYSALPGPRTALLLGGASAHARFDDTLYERVLAQVESIVRSEGGSVLATASRRTPAPVRQRLRERLSALPGVVWRGEADGANPYAGLLGWADRIVCTADSVNMLSEAAATWAPVFVAGVDRIDGRPRRFLASLLERGRIRALDQAPDPYPVTPLRETARVAAQVQARLRW